MSDALNQSSVVIGMLCEVDKLVQAYFTFPVTCTTVERSFSSLQSFLRSSMTAQDPNNLFLLYVYKSITSSLNLETVARDFASVNTHWIYYFGHLKVNYRTIKLFLSTFSLKYLLKALELISEHTPPDPWLVAGFKPGISQCISPPPLKIIILLLTPLFCGSV